MKGKRIAERWREFARHYAEHRDAKAAALKIGYAPSCAKQRGSVLLKKPHVQAYLLELDEEATAQAVDELRITKEDVLKGLFEETKQDRKGTTQAARVRAWLAIAEVAGFKQPDKVTVTENALQEVMDAVNGCTTGLPDPEREAL